jgi:Spy/CpxP family protein refolding chaperone
MKRKRLIQGTIISGISALIGFAVLAGVFVGCGPRGYHSSFRGSGMDVDRIGKEIAHRLDLTADQKVQVEKLVEEARTKREEGAIG